MIGFLFMAIILLVIMVFVIFDLFENEGLKPLTASFVFIILIVTNWGLFLFDFYSLFSLEFADLLWKISWISLILMGVIMGVRELKNNKIFAILMIYISLSTVIFFSFSLFIGSM